MTAPATRRARCSARNSARVSLTTPSSSWRWPTPRTPLQGMEIPGQPPGMGGGMMNLGDIFGKAFGQRTVRRRMSVAASYEVLLQEEADKLLDPEMVTKEAVRAVEQNGIVFNRRDRQGRHAAGRARRRRQPGGRAARPAAADRGDNGFHQARSGQDGPYPVHRKRRVSHRQTLGPAAGTAGGVCRSA